jgi:hypothetical protein
LQKLFQFGKVVISKCSAKADSKFSWKFLILLIDLILIFIINYKKYKNVLFSKRKSNVFAEFKQSSF